MLYPDYSKQPQILAVANQKGGVGKTTVALNLAYVEVKKYAKKVLLLDMDSQASSSLALNVDLYDEDKQPTTIDKLLEPMIATGNVPSWETIKEAILTPTYATKERIMKDGKPTMQWREVSKPFGFDLIPSSLGLSLSNFQIQMKGGKVGVIFMNYLSQIIDVIVKNADYDVIIIDTPPALDALSMNAIYAARTGVIITSNMDLMSFRGVQPCRESIETARAHAKKAGIMHRGIIGILLSQYSDRRSNDRTLKVHSNSFEPSPTFKTQIPDSADARKATSMGLLFCQLNRKAEKAFVEFISELDLAVNNPKAFITQWEDRREEDNPDLPEDERYTYEDLLEMEAEEDGITFEQVIAIAQKGAEI